MKRGLGMELSVLMTMGILAGCGSSAAADGNSEAVSEAKTETEDVVEMTMTALNGDTGDVFAGAIQREVDKLSEGSEYNIRIKLECYSSDNYKTKFTTSMTSNTQPDIFFTQGPGFLQPLMDDNKVYPVGDILVNDKEWYGACPDKSTFGPLIFGDEIWTVSSSEQVVVVAYNNKLFQDAGTKVSTVYSEFLETCEVLKQAGISPLAIPCREAWYEGQMLQQLCNVLGGKEFCNYTISDEVQWNHKTFMEAGTLLKQIMDQGYLMDRFLGMSPSKGFELFSNDDVAMFMCITSGVNKLDVLGNPYHNGIDFFLLSSDNPDYNGVNVGSIGQAYAISNQAKNPEVAAVFLKQMTLGDYQQVLTDNAQMAATNVQAGLNNLSEMMIRSRRMFDQIRVYTPWLDRVYGTDESVEFNNASASILDDTDPQEAVDNLQQFVIDNANN